MELPGGNYKVLYRLKVSDNSGTSTICKLYVKATRGGAEREIASMELRPYHFNAPNTWEVFELPVEVRDDDTNVKIGVEFYGGVADLWCDWIRITPAGTSLAGDLKILGSIMGFGGLELGDLRAKGTDTVLRLQSKTGHSRIELREWAISPQYGFDIEYNADDNVLIIRAQDGSSGPKEWLRISRDSGQLVLTRASPGTELIRSFISNEAYPRFKVVANGTMMWGPGSSEPDVKLRRPGAGKLAVEGALVLNQPSETWSLESRVNNQNRFIRWAHGRMRWIGADGTTLCELQPVEGGLSLTAKLDVQKGLKVGGEEVIKADRRLANIQGVACDLRWESGGIGPILIDRATRIPFRLYVEDGVLKIEPVK